MATRNPTAASRLTRAEMLALGDALVRGWNTHDVEALLELMTDDVIYTEPALPAPAVGRRAMREALEETFTATPDFHVVEDEVQVFPDEESQTSMACWVVTGTMTGHLRGIPATGLDLRIAGSTLSKLRDGRICEYTTHYDGLSMLQQIGLLPASDGLGFKAVVTAQVLAGKAKKAIHR